MIRHLSHSSADLYLLCGRKWRFAKVENRTIRPSAALVFGSAFHATVESLLRSRWAGDTVDALAVWSDAWDKAAAHDIDWGRTSPEAECYAGERLFASQDVRALLRSIVPLTKADQPMLEQRFELDVPGIPVPILGFIDVLAEDGVPVDFKTTSSAWSKKRAGDEIQPLIYLAALNQIGHTEHGGRFRHAVFAKDGLKLGGVVHESVHSPEAIEWGLDMLREVWKGIKAEVFVPNAKSCHAYGQRCEFFRECRGRPE